MEQDGQAISGARLDVGDRLVYLEDLTICVRFNFPRLAPYGASLGRGQIIFISDWKETPADAGKHNILQTFHKNET